MKIIAQYQGLNTKCNEDEHSMKIKFGVTAFFIAKALRGIAIYLNKDVTLRIKNKKLKQETLLRAILYDVSCRHDHSSIWTFMCPVKDGALEWVPGAYRHNLILSIKFKGEKS
jgi:hypothetical protein